MPPISLFGRLVSPRSLLEIILVLAVIVLLLMRSCGSTPPITQRGEADSTKYWRNRFQAEVATNVGLQGEFAYKNQRIFKLLDSIAGMHQVKASHIVELVSADIHGHSNLTPVPGSQKKLPARQDSAGLWTAEPAGCPANVQETFVNPYYLAVAQIGDSSYLHLEHYDKLALTWSEEKQGSIFNRKKLLRLTISNQDTSSHLSGIEAYRRIDNQKLSSIAIKADLLLIAQQVHPLIALQYQREEGRAAARITVGKDLYSTMNLGQAPWFGQLGLSFKLVKF